MTGQDEPDERIRAGDTAHFQPEGITEVQSDPLVDIRKPNAVQAGASGPGAVAVFRLEDRPGQLLPHADSVIPGLDQEPLPGTAVKPFCSARAVGWTGVFSTREETEIEPRRPAGEIP